MIDINSLTPAECRAARGAIKWTQSKLAQTCGIKEQTVSEFERARTKAHPLTIKAMREALIDAGVIFERQGDFFVIKFREARKR